MTRLTYRTTVAPAVVGETADGFAREVGRVLADPRGWRKYGYSFAVAAPGSRPDLLIRLEAGEDANALCGSKGLSCWREDERDIVIHGGNWAGGSASRLPPERYHNYVISHEVGHALGLEHQACPVAECARRGLRDCPTPVMSQVTKGPKFISPCVENDWPLDPDWLVDDPRRGPLLRALRVLLALVAVLLACLVAAVALAGRAAAELQAPQPAGRT